MSSKPKQFEAWPRPLTTNASRVRKAWGARTLVLEAHRVARTISVDFAVGLVEKFRLGLKKVLWGLKGLSLANADWPKLTAVEDAVAVRVDGHEARQAPAARG